MVPDKMCITIAFSGFNRLDLWITYVPPEASTLESTDENTIKNNFVSLSAAALLVDIIVDI